MLVQHYVCTGSAHWKFVGRKFTSTDALEIRSSAEDKDPYILSYSMLCSPGDKRLFIFPKEQNKAGAGDIQAVKEKN